MTTPASSSGSERVNVLYAAARAASMCTASERYVLTSIPRLQVTRLRMHYTHPISRPRLARHECWCGPGTTPAPAPASAPAAAPASAPAPAAASAPAPAAHARRSCCTSSTMSGSMPRPELGSMCTEQRRPAACRAPAPCCAASAASSGSGSNATVVAPRTHAPQKLPAITMDGVHEGLQAAPARTWLKACSRQDQH